MVFDFGFLDYPNEHPFSLTQIIGYIAMILAVIAFLQRDDTRLKLMICGQCVALVTHFMLLGAYVAMFAAALAGLRIFLSIFARVRRNRRVFVPIFVVLTVILGLVSYQTYLDIFPLLAALIGTVSFFYFEGIKMRVTLVAGSLLWLVHNVLAGSYGPSIMEVMILGSLLWTIDKMKRAEASSRP